MWPAPAPSTTVVATPLASTMAESLVLSVGSDNFDEDGPISHEWFFNRDECDLHNCLMQGLFSASDPFYYSSPISDPYNLRPKDPQKK